MTQKPAGKPRKPRSPSIRCRYCKSIYGTLRQVDATTFEHFDCAERERYPQRCAHGNPPANCDACDRLSDLAYDADRER
jgi:hypothetical protein